MDLLPNKQLSLDLDLAFNIPSKEVLETIADPSIKYILTKSQVWEDILKTWLLIIKNDLNIHCPSILRKASSITMGLQFTDDSTIQKMNSTWREKNQATDVLSFPIIDSNISLPEDECLELGDIVVSIFTARRQAKEMNHELVVELQWLVSHGLLHLLGWDHPNSKALEEMLTFQKQLINTTSKINNSFSTGNQLSINK